MMQIYAEDHGDRFPHQDSDGEAFTTSTAAFAHLLVSSGITADHVFYVRKYPGKRVPNNDGVLKFDECCYSYVTNQSTSSWETSPLVSHAMSGIGTFGVEHPYLQTRKAIVGYVGGHARVESLSSRKPGATIPGPPGSGIDNIFEEGTKQGDGTFKGGYLAVPTRNILHPQ